MRAFLTLLALFCTCDAFGIDFGNFQGIKPVELRQADLNFRHYLAPGLDSVIYPETHHESLNVDLDIDLFRYAYWDSTILSTTTSGQYRMIGLDTELGLRLFPFLNVFYHHESIHVLDRLESFPHFPVYDSWGVTLFLYRRDSSPGSIVR